jgi:hypothetical protein
MRLCISIIPQGENKIERKIVNMKNKTEKCRNEIKSYITREGLTMTEVVEMLADEHGWSESVPNLSGKLRRGSLRYTEAVELADVMGYDLVWLKRREGR